MPTDEEVQNALLAIYSRLGVIEGKVNLVARADRARILEVLEEVVRKQPLIGQIYLLLDGKSAQRSIHEKLTELGIQSSEMTVSRRLSEMETEHGIAEPILMGPAKIHRKNREMENVLNLSKNIRKWLVSADQTVPEDIMRQRRKRL
jgi:hypothetical protein